MLIATASSSLFARFRTVCPLTDVNQESFWDAAANYTPPKAKQNVLSLQKKTVVCFPPSFETSHQHPLICLNLNLFYILAL